MITKAQALAWLPLVLVRIAEAADCPVPTPPELVAEDVAILEKFYYATGGATWLKNGNWTSSYTPCGNWYGVTCSGEMVTVRLPKNNLTGTAPLEIFSIGAKSNLKGSVTIREHPMLSGTLPAALTNLEYVSFSETSLSGTLPATGLEALTRLFGPDSKLSGTLPPELSNASKVTKLALSRMPLSGTIPPELSKLRELQQLTLSGNNHLSGSIPNLGSWSTKLADVTIGWSTGVERPWGHPSNTMDGFISGTLPPFYPMSLAMMIVGHTLVSGTLPPSVTYMQEKAPGTRFNQVYLKKNRISGTLSPRLGDWRGMQPIYEFMVQKNKISGTLPDRLLSSGRFQKLEAEANYISGTIPFQAIADGFKVEVHPGANAKWDSPGCVNLELANNKLSGTISEDFCTLTKLKNFWVPFNFMSGTIPACGPANLSSHGCMLTASQGLTKVDDEGKNVFAPSSLSYMFSEMGTPNGTNAFSCPLPVGEVMEYGVENTTVLAEYTDKYCAMRPDEATDNSNQTCNDLEKLVGENEMTHEEYDSLCPLSYNLYDLGFTSVASCAKRCANARAINFGDGKPPAPCSLIFYKVQPQTNRVNCMAANLKTSQDGKLLCPTRWSPDTTTYIPHYAEVVRTLEPSPAPYSCADSLSCTELVCPQGCVVARARERSVLFASSDGPNPDCPEGCVAA